MLLKSLQEENISFLRLQKTSVGSKKKVNNFPPFISFDLAEIEKLERSPDLSSFCVLTRNLFTFAPQNFSSVILKYLTR